jgi:hypothetical protein
MFSMATRGVQSVAALLSIVLVGRFVDRTTQGYYFAFVSFVVFVQLAEFGLGYAVMQSASHELRSDPGVAGTGQDMRRGRLAELLRGAIRFNTCAVLVATAILAIGGTTMLRAGEPSVGDSQVVWLAPWAAALVGAALSQLPNPRVALLEGDGHTEAVWRFRLIQELATAFALCLSLRIGLGLWAVAISYGVRLNAAAIWLHRGWRRMYFAELAAHRMAADSGYWWEEVWPFQWRIGVSALCGYLTFQFFTPLMFALKGAVVAGQFGMTLSLTNGLLTATTAWLASQAPIFGRLISQRSFAELDTRFSRALWSSVGVAVVAGIALELTVMTADKLNYTIAGRVLPPMPFGLFVAAAVVNHVVFGMAVFLRAHRREPLMAPSLLGAVLTPLVAYVGGRFGATTVAASYFGLAVVGLVITTVIFLSRGRAWRVQALA